MFDLTVWKRENQIIHFYTSPFQFALDSKYFEYKLHKRETCSQFFFIHAKKSKTIVKSTGDISNSFLLSLIFSLLLIQNVLSMDVINGKLSMMDESIRKLGVGDPRVRVRIQPNLKILEIQLLDMLPQMVFIGSTTYSV